MKSTRIFVFAFGTVLFVLCASAQAQQPGKIPRVAFLGTASASVVADRLDAFRKGLHDRSYFVVRREAE